MTNLTSSRDRKRENRCEICDWNGRADKEEKKKEKKKKKKKRSRAFGTIVGRFERSNKLLNWRLAGEQANNANGSVCRIRNGNVSRNRNFGSKIDFGEWKIDAVADRWGDSIQELTLAITNQWSPIWYDWIARQRRQKEGEEEGGKIKVKREREREREKRRGDLHVQRR